MESKLHARRKKHKEDIRNQVSQQSLERLSDKFKTAGGETRFSPNRRVEDKRRSLENRANMLQDRRRASKERKEKDAKDTKEKARISQEDALLQTPKIVPINVRPEKLQQVKPRINDSEVYIVVQEASEEEPALPALTIPPPQVTIVREPSQKKIKDFISTEKPTLAPKSISTSKIVFKILSEAESPQKPSASKTAGTGSRSRDKKSLERISDRPLAKLIDIKEGSDINPSLQHQNNQAAAVPLQSRIVPPSPQASSKEADILLSSLNLIIFQRTVPRK